MNEKYIGPNKLVGATELDYKTPGGDDVVKVMYENPECFSPTILPKKVFERLVRDEPMDYTEFRKFRCDAFIQKLTEMFLEENVVYGDIKYILESLMKKLDASLDRGTSYLWFKDDKKFNPDDIMKDLSLLEINNVLESMNKKDVDTGAGEKGE